MDLSPFYKTMELREFADRVLFSADLETKLASHKGPFTDAAPGPAERVPLPARPPNLQFCERKESPAMPHPDTFGDPLRRGVAHHIMANHELQALEVMAWVLRAFPDAPPAFRLGLAGVMGDEQRHTRLHMQRCRELGVEFGTLKVNRYFWGKAQEFTSLLDYLAGLPLTFEGCNLDHTLEFEQWFEAVGDPKSAGVMRAIHHDEIEHVGFGWRWLRALKDPSQSEWEAYEAHLHWPLRPEKSRGKTFHRVAREAAGLSDEFIDRLEAFGEGELR